MSICGDSRDLYAGLLDAPPNLAECLIVLIHEGAYYVLYAWKTSLDNILPSRATFALQKH